jgi:hypothetical protein
MAKEGLLGSLGLKSNMNIMGLAARDKASQAEMAAVWATLENLDKKTIKQATKPSVVIQQQQQAQQTRWETPKESKAEKTQPLNVENITFTTNTFSDASEAEKDRLNRITDKNISLAKDMTSYIKTIAYNTKQKLKQDTKIYKALEKAGKGGGGFGIGIGKDGKAGASGADGSSSIVKPEDNLGLFDKFFKMITDFWYKWMSIVSGVMPLIWGAKAVGLVMKGAFSALKLSGKFVWGGLKGITMIPGAIGTIFSTIICLPKKVGGLIGKFFKLFKSSGKYLNAFSASNNI